jgi:hypothetical protein
MGLLLLRVFTLQRKKFNIFVCNIIFPDGLHTGCYFIYKHVFSLQVWFFSFSVKIIHIYFFVPPIWISDLIPEFGGVCY